MDRCLERNTWFEKRTKFEDQCFVPSEELEQIALVYLSSDVVLIGSVHRSLSSQNGSCSDIGTDCPQFCSCALGTMETSVYVNCQFRNLTQLPRGVPKCDDRHVQYYLNLSSNQLTYLSGDFEYSDRIVSLDVSNNKIDRISPTFFNRGKVAVFQTLYLQDNNLISLPENAKFALEQGKPDLTLSNNPWECDCYVPWLYDYLKSKDYSGLDNMTCFQKIKNESLSFLGYIVDSHCEDSYSLPHYVVIIICLSIAYLTIVSFLAFLYTIRRRVKVRGTNVVV